MKNYRWGIIGPGKIAHKFAVALTLAGGARLEAIASRDGHRAREFAEEFNVPRYYDSYEALAKDPDIDAIYIATPHAFHCDQALLCLAHGKPVLCEKPMALSRRQVERMVQAARDNKVFLMEAMWTRLLPHTEKILELGRPQNILATGQLAATGADESCHALLQYSAGATAVLSSTFACQTSITAEIAGTEGSIRIPSAWYKNDNFTLHRPGVEPELFQLEPMVNGFEYQIRELMQCVDKGLIESPSMSHDFSLLMSGTMDEIRRQVGVRYPGE
jgi:predicted dehydrogenase